MRKLLTLISSLAVAGPLQAAMSRDPRPAATQPASVAPRAMAAQQSAPQFTGITFTPVLENDKVRVTRARMDVDAREALHTHGADIVVVHLSGGEIEDTANGRTTVNRWKAGDVEFEARGSSHSARNVGKPVDVVLVALK